MACTRPFRPRYVALVPLIALALLAACTDDPVAPTAPPARRSAQAVDVSTAERSALRELTRAVAMAMENQGVRQQMKNDMRASRVTHEHKLHLGSYVKGQGGGVLLAQMTRATGLSRDTLQKLIAAVRPLELYVPVEAHRERWSGGPELLVASAFDDGDQPVAFDVNGREVTLDIATPPSQPVVALVPVETDFAAPLDETKLQGRRLRNVDDQGGESIGTLVIEQPTDGAVGTSSYVAGVDDGIYMIRNSLRDDGEDWIKGDPELEVHLHGPRTQANPQYGEDLSCSGEQVVDYRKWYNQDAMHFVGTIGGGAPLLADRYDFNQAQAKFPDGGRYFIMWEDDDTHCVIKTDKDMLKIVLDAAKAAGSAGAAVAAKGGGPKGAVVTTVVTFLFKVFTNADFIRTNDDLIGVMVPKANAPNCPASLPTHCIYHGGTYNGDADLIAQWATVENGRSYMANVVTDVATVEMNLNGARQLSATVYDQYGAVRSGHPVGWRSTSASVVSVSETGVVSGPDAGTAIVYARACDPECIDRPIEVRVTGPRLSGPTYLSAGQTGTISGDILNPRQGAYWYEWTTSTCTNGSTCPSETYAVRSGWGAPGQIDIWVGAYDRYVDVGLAIYTAPGGELVGAKSLYVAGPDQWPGCESTWEIDCQPFLTVQPAGTKTPGARPSAATPSKRNGNAPRR